jgi:YidC/Oxa1 family membrane protein insertase
MVQNVFNTPVLGPINIAITNVLLLFYQGLVLLHVPNPLGLSIILLTIAIRLILAPFTASQLHATRKMQKITPHLNKLKEKHKGDAKMLQQETMKLYKEHGVNPMAGCLPMLIQLPLIWALYSVLQNVVSASPKVILTQINHIVYLPFLKLPTAWDTNFFGLSLGTSPSKLISTVGIAVLLFPIATGVFQFIQSKMMFAPAEPENPKDIVISGDKKEKKGDDFASAMQTQSLYIFPIMIGFFSFTLPIGLSLYWITFTLFGIIQQYMIQGWGGLQPWIDKIKK